MQSGFVDSVSNWKGVSRTLDLASKVYVWGVRSLKGGYLFLLLFTSLAILWTVTILSRNQHVELIVKGVPRTFELFLYPQVSRCVVIWIETSFCTPLARGAALRLGWGMGKGHVYVDEHVRSGIDLKCVSLSSLSALAPARLKESRGGCVSVSQAWRLLWGCTFTLPLSAFAQLLANHTRTHIGHTKHPQVNNTTSVRRCSTTPRDKIEKSTPCPKMLAMIYLTTTPLQRPLLSYRVQCRGGGGLDVSVLRIKYTNGRVRSKKNRGIGVQWVFRQALYVQHRRRKDFFKEEDHFMRNYGSLIKGMPWESEKTHSNNWSTSFSWWLKPNPFYCTPYWHLCQFSIYFYWSQTDRQTDRKTDRQMLLRSKEDQTERSKDSLRWSCTMGLSPLCVCVCVCVWNTLVHLGICKEKCTPSQRAIN